MTDFYFTFGHGQTGFPGYVRVYAPDYDRARDLMIAAHGSRWALAYERYEDMDQHDRNMRGQLVWEVSIK